MANPDRLSALDSTFLHLEDDSTAHMHVASVMVFEGKAPTPQELVDHILSRLHLVPRYRQRLAYVPLGQGRPVWTDDPHFNPRYHIRHTALPRPADDAALKLYADWLGISLAKAKRTRDEFYPWQALDPDRISGLEAIAQDAVSLKYLTAPLTQAQLNELVVKFPL